MNEANILVVDDECSFLQSLLRALRLEPYRLVVAERGEKALELVRRTNIDVVVSDLRMPGMNGLELLRRLRSSHPEIPAILMTAFPDVDTVIRAVNDLGIYKYFVKPLAIDDLRLSIRRAIALARARTVISSCAYFANELDELISQFFQQLTLTRMLTVEYIVKVVECRAPHLGSHIRRTGHYFSLLVEQLEKNRKFSDYLQSVDIDQLSLQASLHDIGKVAISDEILLKPGLLTSAEFEAMKHHTTVGHSVLRDAGRNLGAHSFLEMAGEMALTHHERWDGRGYPMGLAGEKIPIPGRLIALADAYDAMISQRPYKAAMRHDRARSIILKESGSQFDPDVVAAFVTVEKEFCRVAEPKN